MTAGKSPPNSPPSTSAQRNATGKSPAGKNTQLTLDEIRHGVAGVLGILKTWAISDQQVMAMLGARSLDELKRWVNGEARSYPGDLPHRIGLISGIHTRLRQTYLDQRQVLAWLSSPSPHFENKRPIDVMAGGNLIGLMMVRDELKGAERDMPRRPDGRPLR
ncbi:MAG TPA: MbcA/ParS/Xre antitoxin family protein [Dongiaceae bacterium]|nr:MbcA/ParS/Xre antitoxin family protein [Dongiaceae bacterium]